MFKFDKQPSGRNVWLEPIGDLGHVPEKGKELSNELGVNVSNRAFRPVLMTSVKI